MKRHDGWRVLVLSQGGKRPSLTTVDGIIGLFGLSLAWIPIISTGGC